MTNNDRNHRRHVIAGACLLVAGGLSLAGLVLRNGAGAERSEFAPIDMADGYSLAGPSGEPRLDTCGDVVRVTEEEMFEAMHALAGDARPADVDGAQAEEQSQVVEKAVRRTLRTMDLYHDREAAMALLGDPEHPRANEFRRRLAKQISTLQRRAGLAEIPQFEHDPASGEADLAEVDPALVAGSTQELFDYVVEQRNRLATC